MEKEYLKLGIREFCEQMMDGKFADSDIYIYADNAPDRDEFLNEVLVAAMLSDTNNDYYEMVERHFKQQKPPTKRNGRKQEVFSDIVSHPNKEWFMAQLHQLIGDKPQGARVGKILLKALLDTYLMRFPNEKEFTDEFGLNGSWEAIRKFNDKEKVNESNKLFEELSNIVF